MNTAFCGAPELIAVLARRASDDPAEDSVEERELVKTLFECDHGDWDIGFTQCAAHGLNADLV